MSAAGTKAGGEPALGIIGGSGLYEMEGIEDLHWVRVRTPFGDPSDAYCTGRLGDRRGVFPPPPRRGPRITPPPINNPRQTHGARAPGPPRAHSGDAGGGLARG